MVDLARQPSVNQRFLVKIPLNQRFFILFFKKLLTFYTFLDKISIVKYCVYLCARSPVDRTLASGAESVGSTPAERTITIHQPREMSRGFFMQRRKGFF